MGPGRWNRGLKAPLHSQYSQNIAWNEPCMTALIVIVLSQAFAALSMRSMDSPKKKSALSRVRLTLIDSLPCIAAPLLATFCSGRTTVLFFSPRDG